MVYLNTMRIANAFMPQELYNERIGDSDVSVILMYQSYFL